MKRNIVAGMVIVLLFSTISLNAQKSNKEVTASGKIVAYNETGEVQMVINKDMIDRFNSIEVSEDYITWNYLYSTYDWSTVRFLIAAYHNNEIDITSKADVERMAYTYQKTMETLYNANTITPQKIEDKTPLTTEVDEQ